MSKLFIIGNGFDLAHGLPTKYENFKKYLEDEYPESRDREFTKDYSSVDSPDGSSEYDVNGMVALLTQVISEAAEDDTTWKEFEEYLGVLDLTTHFDEIYDVFKQFKDPNPHQVLGEQENYAKGLTHTVPKIKDFFADWIITIDLDEVVLKDNFSGLIDYEKDKFINFNYTTLLENNYRVNSDLIWHPHGDINSTIQVGHGSKEFIGYNLSKDIDCILSAIHEELKKDTQSIISRNINKFESLNDISKIYSYGFSFSDVDLPYIQKICKEIDTKRVTWYLSNYDKDETIKNKKILIDDCDFKGHISTFSI